MMTATKSEEGHNPTGDLHTQFVQHVGSLRNSVVGVMDHFEHLTICFQRTLEEGQGCTDVLVNVSTQLSKNFMAVSRSFLECLSDLATMGKAMSSVAEVSPDTASALMVNLYSAFFRQMKTYFCDSGEKFTACSDLFERGKAAFYKDSSIALGGGVDRRSSTSAATLHGLETVHSTHSISDALEGGRPEAVPPAAEEDALDSAVLLQRSGEDGLTSFPRTTSFLQSIATHESSSEAAEKNASASEGSNRAAEAHPAASAFLHDREPPYVQVSTTVEDALGHLVLAHRPAQFEEVDTLLSQEPIASYYIRLVQPGSLAYFIVKNYFNTDEDVQTDLLCEIMETNRVEVEPMGSTAGEVVIRGGEDLSWVPSCAWRSSGSEDHACLFYTMYTLIEQTQTSSRIAFIQDALVCPDYAQVEVLHAVSLLDAAPQYAKVSVHTTALKGTLGGARAAAMAGLLRRSFRRLGFLEVTEGCVWEAVRGLEASDGGSRYTAQGFAARGALKGEEDPMAALHSTMQLASLDELGQGATGMNFTIRDVARGAVRGGMEVLKAPLTLGRAVGEAVLDVTGVSDTVRTNIENLLRKTFPSLSDEKIIDFFNAAWIDGGSPKQGYLYMTEFWVCFVSPISNAQFAIEFEEIKEIQKSKSDKVLSNAISITTHLAEEYFLTGFLKRDQAYSSLMNHWIKG